MTSERQTRKEYERVGPEAPPKPWEAQESDNGALPMAVARDMDTSDDAFIPTSAPLDPRGDHDHYAGHEDDPDVRPKGEDPIWDNDDERLMPLHADERPVGNPMREPAEEEND